MANDRQYQVSARVVATRGVAEYRATIDEVVNQHDVVLEVGCEWGTTTQHLAARAAKVVGTDVSSVCIERGRREHPDLDLRVLDAFDLAAVLRLRISFTKVYMDLSGLSGYRSLLDLIALLNSYGSLLRPDTIVVKSGGLKQFVSRCRPWSPS